VIAQDRASNAPPSIWPLAWTWILGVLAGLSFLAFAFDGVLTGWIRETFWPYQMAGPEWPVLLASKLGKYGDWPQLMVVGLIAYGWCRFRKRQTAGRMILILMLGSTLAGATVNALRLTTGRARPSNPEVQGWIGPVYEGRLTIGRHAFNSFPSGHTATAFGFFGPLLFAKRYRRIGWWLLPIPVAIAVARVFTLSHHLSDVCFSATISLTVAAILVRLAVVRKGWGLDRVGD